MSDQKCYDKAVARGERTFTLVARDISSPEVICEWIKQNINTAPEEKLNEALEAALEMRNNACRRFAD